MNEKDAKFLEDVRRQLDHSVADLDPEIARRLAGVRSRAIEAAEDGSRISWWRWSTGFASFAVLVMIFLFGLPGQKPQVAPPDLMSLQVLSGQEPLDFFKQDLEFYQWLSEVMNNEGNSSGQYDYHNPDPDAPIRSGGAGQAQGGDLSEFGIDRISGRVQG